MAFVTLTTDFGKNNYNIASLKGAIFSAYPKSQLIDISNEIGNFDIIEASFMLSNSYKFYPKNTVHVIAVNGFYSSRVRLLLLKKNDYFFIAPDNGILSLIFDEPDINDIRYIEYGKKTGDFYTTIAELVAQSQQQDDFDSIGEKVLSINKRITLKPVISANTIRATVIFIDKFGNAILNVTKDLFDTYIANKPFRLYYSPKGFIDKIQNKYSDVPFGDELMLFNSAGYLEIAINMGNANTNLGISKDATLQIVF